MAWLRRFCALRGAVLASQCRPAASARVLSQVRCGPRRLVQKIYLRQRAEVVNFKPEHSRCAGQNEDMKVWTG